MLVAVVGNKGEVNSLNLNKRNRTMPAMAAALKTVPTPSVYIFNVGSRQWVKENGGQGRYTVPACAPGEEYSEPLVIDGLVLSEYDLGDGAGNMATAVDPGMLVAEDIIGARSTSAALDLFTTNLQWFGVFASMNQTPTKAELGQARSKLKQMMQLIYAKGSELVQTGQAVSQADRKNYNEAAEFLGARPLWGDQDHLMARCPECKEPIISEATFCKHCQQPIDPASVQARAKKRTKANEADLKAE